ncbi:hypothetical protein Sm713_62780 [Streptomyces sp. TS71-3]|nr:hypothetical protein Sm713_62780 [Streptomyces sp. TS71-3]
MLTTSTQEVLDLVERDPLLDEPRGTGVPHGVRRIVRNELLLAVGVKVVGAIDGGPPGLAAPVTVVEATAGPPLGDGGEDERVAVEPVDVAFECLQDVGRERDLPAALGALRVLLDAALGV